MFSTAACQRAETFGFGGDAGADDDGGRDAGLLADAGASDGGPADAGLPPDGGPSEDAGSDAGPVTDGGPLDGGLLSCGLTGCGAGEVCCAATGQCYSEGCLACCMGVPPPDGGVGCVDDSQCPAQSTCAGVGCATPGVCEALPFGCPAIFQPVCGCDGQTYENACFAAFAGVRTASDGVCPTTDGGAPTDGGATTCPACGPTEACCASTGACYQSTCTTCCPGLTPPDGGLVCTENSQCATATMANPLLWCAGTGCTAPGVCEAPPTSCTGVFAPVCGCDGQTYLNDCAAAENSIRVNYLGACAAADAGTDAGPSDAGATDAGPEDAGPGDAGPGDAGPGDAGVSPGDAGTSDAGPIPCVFGGALTECPATLVCCLTNDLCVSPVCADCCPAATDGGMACTTNSDCPSGTGLFGEYCGGGGCATPGTCEPEPTTCPGVVDPVCGCDGQTYTNACDAALVGVRVSYTGMCTTSADAGPKDAGPVDAGPVPCGNSSTAGCPDGDTCCMATLMCVPSTCLDCCPAMQTDAGVPGCTTNAECATTATARDYCAGTGCGTPGTCEAEPGVCPLVDAPVCGCNGVTYSNSCYCEQAGERVASMGACGASSDAGPQSCGGPGGIICPMEETCCASTLMCVPIVCAGNDCCPAVDGGTAACTTNADCPVTTDYCAGTGCGTAGTCAPIPTVCPPPSTVPMPVCGCNDLTYKSACLAEQAGVRVASEGSCAAGDGGTVDAGTGDAGVPCGANGTICGTGEVCCQFSGQCVSSACLACCPPPGG